MSKETEKNSMDNFNNCAEVKTLRTLNSKLKFLLANFILIFTDALLADLQNTISPGSQHSSGYGSLKTPRGVRNSPGSDASLGRTDSYTVKSVSIFFL